MGSGDMAGFALDCLWDVGQVPWLLQLTEGDFVDMLVAPCVMSFKILGYQRSTIRASTGFQTLTRLPRVENVYIGESGGVKPYALRALWELRLEAADHLSLVPPTVKSFNYEIHALRELSLHPGVDAASYLSSNGLDEFSIGLRKLSIQLTFRRLDHVRISSALFWPSAEARHSKQASGLTWANMEHLEIIGMPPYKANGTWILDNGPSSEEPILDESEWDYEVEGYGQRGLIQRSELKALYETMGKAPPNAENPPPRIRLLHLGGETKDARL